MSFYQELKEQKKGREEKIIIKKMEKKKKKKKKWRGKEEPKLGIEQPLFQLGNLRPLLHCGFVKAFLYRNMNSILPHQGCHFQGGNVWHTTLTIS